MHNCDTRGTKLLLQLQIQGVATSQTQACVSKGKRGTALLEEEMREKGRCCRERDPRAGTAKTKVALGYPLGFLAFLGKMWAYPTKCRISPFHQGWHMPHPHLWDGEKSPSQPCQGTGLAVTCSQLGLAGPWVTTAKPDSTATKL